MNIRDVLYIRNTGKLRPRASIQDKFLARKLSGGGTKTKTVDFTPIITVSDALAKNALAFSAKIVPVQSGSGDPSPQNIRPISGWTGANATVAGKNLLDCTHPLVANPNGTGNDGLPFYPPAIGSYTIKPSKRGADNKRYAYLRGFIVHSDGTYEDYLAFSSSASDADYTARTFEVTQKGDWIFLYAAAGTSNPRNIVFSEPQVELGSTATAYTPYITPSVYPISWQTEAGTIFGGEVDFVRGKVKATLAEVDLGSLDWEERQGGTYRATLADMPTTGQLSETALCSALLIKPNAYGTSYPDENNIIWKYVNSRYLFVRVSDTSILSGIKLVFPLETPIEYDIAPTDIPLLLGNNTIWTDTGDSAMTYLAKKA